VAHNFLKLTVIVRTALGLLQREIILPALVWRDAVPDFAGAQGDNGHPAGAGPAQGPPGGAARRTNPVNTDDVRETAVDVRLDTHVYQAVAVTDEDLTLDIAGFGSQVLMPQIRAVAEDVEDQVAAEMVGANYATTIALDEVKPEDTLADARVTLNKANVPMGQRYAVLGADMEAVFLKAEALKRVDASGTDSALREAQIGRLPGFDTFISNAIPPNLGFCFHRTAYVLGMRAPRVPDGATFGQSQSFPQLAMRWLRDYDAAFLRDRSVV
jgi:hypothetical protein